MHTREPLSRSIPATTMVALVLVGILGPFGTDIVLPALPGMAHDLGVTQGSVRLTLSAFTVGMAVGQLVIGTLSDRFGRVRLMRLGAGAAALSAFSASTAQSLDFLIVACAILGLASSAGVVTGRAYISDSVVGLAATRQFTLLQMAISCGPVAGPIAGALLLTVGNWRTIFVALAAFAVVGTLATLMFVPESLTPERRRPESFAGIAQTMARIIRTPRYITFAASMWFGFGTLFAYISTSSFIFQSTLGQSPAVFASIFALNGVGLVTASLATAHLSRRVNASHLLLVGLVLQAAALAVLVAIMVLGAASVFSVGACLFVTTSSMGMVFGPATSLAVAPVRETSGTALALLGSIQFAAAAVASSLTAVVSADPLVGFAVVASVSCLLALAAATLGSRTFTTTHPQED